MQNINHRNIQLLYENLTPYNTTIETELPMPKFILDSKRCLFQKQKTIFERGQSRVLYAEVSVVALSSVEVTTAMIVDAGLCNGPT